MKHRVCDWPKCITVLSAHNPGKFCWTHTPDLGAKGTEHLRPKRHMSDAFVSGIEGTYDITSSERRRIKRGG